MRRHELRSTMMTSNRPLEDWARLIGDVTVAAAILNRFLQDAELIQINGRSYRPRGRHADTKKGLAKNVTGSEAAEPAKRVFRESTARSKTSQTCSPRRTARTAKKTSR